MRCVGARVLSEDSDREEAGNLSPPSRQQSSDTPICRTGVTGQVPSWVTLNTAVGFVTFRVRHSRGEMYIGHGRLCVCLSVPRRIPVASTVQGDICGNGSGG